MNIQSLEADLLIAREELKKNQALTRRLENDFQKKTLEHIAYIKEEDGILRDMENQLEEDDIVDDVNESEKDRRIRSLEFHLEESKRNSKEKSAEYKVLKDEFISALSFIKKVEIKK